MNTPLISLCQRALARRCLWPLASLVVLAADEALAQTKTATLVANCQSIGLDNFSGTIPGIGRVINYVTTYDGWTDRQPLTQDLGGGQFYISQELRPRSAQPGVYEADYLTVNASGSFVEWGSFTMNLPTADNDQNSLPDFVELDKSGTASLSGSGGANWPRGTTFSLSGQVNRSAGVASGTYTITLQGPVGAISYAGNLYLLHVEGSVSYTQGSNSLLLFNLSMTERGRTFQLTGSTSFTITSPDQIGLPQFSLNSSDNKTYTVKVSTLNRKGKTYVASVALADGSLETSWPDYVNWVLEITDNNDANGNGIPDLSDTPATPPTIMTPPQNRSVVVGTNVTFSVMANGTAPLSYQWRKNGTNLVGEVSASYTISNVQTDQAGSYSVIVTNVAGGVTSQNALLVIEQSPLPAIPTFTKIATGPVVSDRGDSVGVSWGDYDGDGWQDLFVANNSMQPCFLYHNNRDGTFGRVTNAAPVLLPGDHTAGVWGDYDNDGHLDLFCTRYSQKNILYRGDGKGGFAAILTGGIVNDIGYSYGAAWGDFDRDGNIDLFVVNRGDQKNFFYRNNGDSTFARITSGNIVSELGQYTSGTWADYDGDGDADLFVTVGQSGSRNLLYRNDAGTFTKITNGAVVNDVGLSGGASWGDYDNDGDLDLFVTCIGQPNRLYRNDGAGIFTPVEAGALTVGAGQSLGSAWGDYDNDGRLDLFVSNLSFVGNWLYHNNGGGTFTRITNGPVATDQAHSHGAAWADYDNDGFLDFVVVNRTLTGSPAESGATNFLYRNNGNGNRWFKVRLVGTLSNTSAIGAKVRVKATIRGGEMWQLREISGGTGFCAQNALDAHFGLGDAMKVETLRIEWPSGIVQEMHELGVNQILTVTEPPVLRVGRPQVSGRFEIILTSRGGFAYRVDGSADLATWTVINALTNVNGSVQVIDPNAGKFTHRFYRAVKQGQ